MNFFFSVSFTKEYLLNVYKNKNVNISKAALQEGKNIAEQSRIYVDRYAIK